MSKHSRTKFTNGYIVPHRSMVESRKQDSLQGEYAMLPTTAPLLTRIQTILTLTTTRCRCFQNATHNVALGVLRMELLIGGKLVITSATPSTTQSHLSLEVLTMAGIKRQCEFTDEEVREYTDMDLERERNLKLGFTLTGVPKNHRHEKWLKLNASKQSQTPCGSESANSDEFPVGQTPSRLAVANPIRSLHKLRLWPSRGCVLLQQDRLSSGPISTIQPTARPRWST